MDREIVRNLGHCVIHGIDDNPENADKKAPFLQEKTND